MHVKRLLHSLLFMMVLGGLTAWTFQSRQTYNLKEAPPAKPTWVKRWSRVQPALISFLESNPSPSASLKDSDTRFRPRQSFRWVRNRLHIRVLVDPHFQDILRTRMVENGIIIHTEHSGEFEVLATPAQIEKLAHTDGVRTITMPKWMKPLYTSEGLDVVGASLWQQAPITAGTSGTKIGIVDIGFLFYEQTFGLELPPEERIHTRNFRSDQDFKTTEHGTAVAEVVSDFTKDLDLYLAAISTAGELAEAINWLVDQGVEVISGSIGSSYRAGDGTNSPEYQAIQRAWKNGVVPVFAAGNEGLTHWMSNGFVDNDQDGWFEFGPGDELNCFPVSKGVTFSLLLEWYDWPVSETDYDLFLYSWPEIKLIASSRAFQNGSQEPVEYIEHTPSNDGTMCFAIFYQKGPKTHVPIEVFIDTSVCGGYTACFEYTVSEGSVGSPADGKQAIAVGAVIWDTDTLAPYSSRGPTHDGRLKPEISAPTHVSTFAYGHQGYIFTGTSAATPHVTGALALMHSTLLNTLDGTTIYSILLPRAIDLGPVGPDYAYGYGRLYMLVR